MSISKREEPAPGESFGQFRDEPCPDCGGRVIYHFGNWHCIGGYDEQEGHCGWSTERESGGTRPLSCVTSTLEKCPACGSMVVYNGNYFCEHYGSTCGWALPHPARKKADRELALRLTGVTS